MGATQRGRRWLVPVTAVAVVAGVGALGPVVADASPDLPGITAQELLARGADGQGRRSDAARSRPRRGPRPAGAPRDRRAIASQFPDLLTGEHTARVAFAGPDKARVSVLDNMAERVWTTDGKTAWVYDSAKREAVKLTLPAHAGASRRSRRRSRRTTRRPWRRSSWPRSTRRTKVEVSGTEKVAGRDAYKLRLVPKTDKTTVGSVTLAVDSKTWIPLQVTVTAADRQGPGGRSSASRRSRSTYRRRARSRSRRRRV